MLTSRVYFFRINRKIIFIWFQYKSSLPLNLKGRYVLILELDVYCHYGLSLVKSLVTHPMWRRKKYIHTYIHILSFNAFIPQWFLWIILMFHRAFRRTGIPSPKHEQDCWIEKIIVKELMVTGFSFSLKIIKTTNVPLALEKQKRLV